MKKKKKKIKPKKLNDRNLEKGLKQIYKGARKVLDETSKEYKEIVEKNREAWKKLAEM